MAEQLKVEMEASKRSKYEILLPQLEALLAGETDLVANLSNTAAALRTTFQWWWVGFYWVKNDELVLAPFQGPIACTRIKFGKGVCGTAWKENRSLWVPDVDKFPGHIACSSASVSEIVVPISDKSGKVLGLIDVDSERTDVLDNTDCMYLEKIGHLISKRLE